MASPVHFRPEMGSPESHMEVLESRLANARTELQRAIDDDKPEAQIKSLREDVSLVEDDIQALERELPKIE